ncbi:MAG: molybdopterin molybdotransferase MoeA [Actinobacteria bacterium]|nr:molybdopterin molybdotransferase MoeA [Actinomycetota bacterium]
MSTPITVEQAREAALSMVTPLGAERVALTEALGRVLAADARSDIDVAPFDNSAMDGFAVRAADLASATAETPVILEVAADIPAGTWWDGPLAPGQAARIMTGAPVPAGADTVVMVEVTRTASGDGSIGSRVAFAQAPGEGDHIRRRGEEVSAGEVVLSAGEVIGPAAVGLLAATGHATVEVFRRPRVAVISTGSELVEVGMAPGPGKIRNSNSYSLAAQVRAAGGEPLRYPIVHDDVAAIEAAFLRAAEEADYIITSGGVSVGDFDFVRPVLERIGKLAFYKVAMRPGAPQTMGRVGDTPVFGLPGNPTSAYVGFEVFVRPVLRKMQGHTALERPRVTARLAHDVRKRAEKRYYLRARLSASGAPGLEVELAGSQSSALLSAAHRGNCLLVLEAGESHFSAGSLVECMRLDIEEGVVL